MKIRHAFMQLNWPLVIVVLTLSGVSVLNLSSTSLHAVRPVHLSHLYLLVFGFVLMLSTALVDYRRLQRWVVPFYIAVNVALILVLIFGKEVNGARRWLSIAGVGFQPSELAKLAIILALGSWFQRVPRPSGYTLGDLFPMGLMVGFPMFLVLQEPDLGHTLMLGFIGLTMAFFERFERRTLITIVLTGLVSVPIVWSYVLRDYQKDRILTLIDGRVDRLGAGWHAHQAKSRSGAVGV